MWIQIKNPIQGFSKMILIRKHFLSELLQKLKIILQKKIINSLFSAIISINKCMIYKDKKRPTFLLKMMNKISEKKSNETNTAH